MSAAFPSWSLTERLIEEHRLFRRVLALFGNYAEQVVSGKRYDARLARAYLRFFRTFVDQRHHHREERILFPWMAAHGLPRTSGPLVVLKTEHELGREVRRDLDRAARMLLDSPGQLAARVRFHGLALRFTELFTAHMGKEEQVLFPLARQIAARNGGELQGTGGWLTRETEWIGRLEAAMVGERLHPSLALHSLGTPEGFERLCRESLNGSTVLGKRRSWRALRPWASRGRQHKTRRGHEAVAGG